MTAYTLLSNPNLIRRRLLAPVIAFLLLVILGSPTAAETRPKLVINGANVAETPVIYHDVIFVPLKALAEHLSINSGWLDDTKTVRLSSPDAVVYMKVGERTALANSGTLKLTEGPRMVDGQVVVPLRSLAGPFGFEVDYVRKSQTVKIESPKYAIGSISYGLLEGEPVVTLAGDGPIEASPKLKGNTITLELPRARLRAGKSPLETGNPVIRRIEWEQTRPTLARVKISLSSSVPYTVERDPSTPSVVRVRFQKQLTGATITRDDKAVRLNFLTSGVPGAIKTSRLVNPERLVFDLEGFTLASLVSEAKTGDPWVKSMRFGQFTPNTVRVVLTMNGPADSLRESSANGPGGTFRLLSRVTGVTAVSAKNNTRIKVDMGLATEWTATVQRRPAAVILHLPSAVLAGTIDDVRVGDGVVDRISVSQNGQNQVDVVVALPNYAGHQIVKDRDGSLVLEVDRSPVAGRKILLDAGHGGTDPGAIGPSGLLEKDVNLDVTLRLARLLGDAGATVYLARSEDVFIPLYDRPRMANQKGADMFVSIHSNANVKPQDGGTETYYHPEKPGSKVLAQLVQSELVKELGLLNRQIKASSGLVVTRETIMPSILVETAFLSNPIEEQLLADPAFRERAASAVWRGIQAFFWQLLDDPSLARAYYLGQNAPQPAASALTATSQPAPVPTTAPTSASAPGSTP